MKEPRKITDPAEITAAIERYRLGFSTHELAEQLGAGKNHMRYVLQKAGAPMRTSSYITAATVVEFPAPPAAAIAEVVDRYEGGASSNQEIHHAVNEIAKRYDVPRAILAIHALGDGGVKAAKRRGASHLIRLESDMRRQTESMIAEFDRRRALRLACEPSFQTATANQG